jgi:ABC-type uncharacterized transport system permease subunit
VCLRGEDLTNAPQRPSSGVVWEISLRTARGWAWLPALAIVIGLLLGAILLSMMGIHPWEAYQAMLVMALSGGLAALAGVCEVAGVQGQLKHGLSLGYGYTAIIVAWLARLNPWATIVASIFLGGLLVGSDMLQIAMNLPVAVAYVLQGLVLFALLSVEFLVSHRVVWKRRSEG